MEIQELREQDRLAWEPLARGYKDFYRTPTRVEEYDAAWQRLMEARGVYGLGAWVDERLVGIAHYLMLPSTWGTPVCYLQDLFTAPEARNKGVARALIETVASHAKSVDASRYYWFTQETNVQARRLYDQVAKYNGFIRYDYPMAAA
jgi:GNAT superfamily N-acetyltransferase